VGVISENICYLTGQANTNYQKSKLFIRLTFFYLKKLCLKILI
jgi:hypothetical protein